MLDLDPGQTILGPTVNCRLSLFCLFSFLVLSLSRVSGRKRKGVKIGFPLAADCCISSRVSACRDEDPL
jgi:hypothetical protein